MGTPPLRRGRPPTAAMKQSALWCNFFAVLLPFIGSAVFYHSGYLFGRSTLDDAEVLSSTTLFCGDGTVGIGICEDTTKCCNAWGFCGYSEDFCSLEKGCISGPGCPAEFGGQNYTGLAINWCGEGSIGNGLCEDTSLCCNKWGFCGSGKSYCQKEKGCISGPGCDTDFTPTLVDAWSERGMDTSEIEDELSEIRLNMQKMKSQLELAMPSCPPCGNGMIGSGICADASQCCNAFGYCGKGLSFCSAQEGCISGPACPYAGLPDKVCIPAIPSDFREGIILRTKTDVELKEEEEQFANVDPLSLPCGDGIVGSGQCTDEAECCDSKGFCVDAAFCEIDDYCFSGPGCAQPLQESLSQSESCVSVSQKEWEAAFTINGFDLPLELGLLDNVRRYCATLGRMTSKRELAMFMAQIMMESRFFFTRELVCVQNIKACEDQYGGYDKVTGELYYGRGYMQITWVQNYVDFSTDFYGDLRAYHEPNLVADNVPLESAIWFWGSRVHSGGVLAGKLGSATNKINGALECNVDATDAMSQKARTRYGYYAAIYAAWGLEEIDGPADESGCYAVAAAAEVAAAGVRHRALRKMPG